jgi:hypothetical protein
VVAITTLGSPWWVDRLVLRRPVRRQLKWCVQELRTRPGFDMLSFYGADNLQPERVSALSDRLRRS